MLLRGGNTVIGILKTETIIHKMQKEEVSSRFRELTLFILCALRFYNILFYCCDIIGYGLIYGIVKPV